MADPVVINSSYQRDNLKYIDLNKQCDIGGLIFEDCQSYTGKTPAQIVELTK